MLLRSCVSSGQGDVADLTPSLMPDPSRAQAGITLPRQRLHPGISVEYPKISSQIPSRSSLEQGSRFRILVGRLTGQFTSCHDRSFLSGGSPHRARHHLASLTGSRSVTRFAFWAESAENAAQAAALWFMSRHHGIYSLSSGQAW